MATTDPLAITALVIRIVAGVGTASFLGYQVQPIAALIALTAGGATTVDDGEIPDRFFPALRYFAWLLTCPVLIVHIFGLPIGMKNKQPQKMLAALVLNQLITVLGMSSILFSSARIALFVIAGLLFVLLCKLTFDIFYTCYLTFPGDARTEVVLVGLVAFVGWSGFPLVHILGPEWLGVMTPGQSEIMVTVFDLISKNLYALLAWKIKNVTVREALEEAEKAASKIDRTKSMDEAVKQYEMIVGMAPAPRSSFRLEEDARMSTLRAIDRATETVAEAVETASSQLARESCLHILLCEADPLYQRAMEDQIMRVAEEGLGLNVEITPVFHVEDIPSYRHRGIPPVFHLAFVPVSALEEAFKVGQVEGEEEDTTSGPTMAEFVKNIFGIAEGEGPLVAAYDFGQDVRAPPRGGAASRGAAECVALGVDFLLSSPTSRIVLDKLLRRIADQASADVYVQRQIENARRRLHDSVRRALETSLRGSAIVNLDDYGRYSAPSSPDGSERDNEELWEEYRQTRNPDAAGGQSSGAVVRPNIRAGRAGRRDSGLFAAALGLQSGGVEFDEALASRAMPRRVPPPQKQQKVPTPQHLVVSDAEEPEDTLGLGAAHTVHSLREVFHEHDDVEAPPPPFRSPRDQQQYQRQVRRGVGRNPPNYQPRYQGTVDDIEVARSQSRARRERAARERAPRRGGPRYEEQDQFFEATRSPRSVERASPRRL